ncbi:MAG: M48 family metallopeptidase [Bryobacterales bacterium]|nr:M48 family metallopeptidase [Bryobacterales bacterium]
MQRALVIGVLLVAGMALAYVGKPERHVSPEAVAELWADLFRDTDDFGFQVSQGRLKNEIALGRIMAAQFQPGRSSDAAGQARIDRIGKALAVHVQRTGIPYQFTLVSGPTINAFALPGGPIFVYEGMLAAVVNDDELAAILGHEIAHVDLRHPWRRNRGSAFNPVYAQFQEIEADARGVHLAVRARYRADGALTLFQRVASQSGAGSDPNTPLEETVGLLGSALTDYFRSHPPDTERIRRLRALSRTLTSSTVR